MNGFKKCPNGHYYQDNLQQCPYCPTGMGTGAGTTTIPENEQGNTTKTQVY